MGNRNLAIFSLFFLFFSQCNSPIKKGSLLINIYNSYQLEQDFIFYKDTIEVWDINKKLILKRYVKESKLLIDSLVFGQAIIKYKNIYDEVVSYEIEVKKVIDTLNVDLCRNTWQNYSGNLIITSLQTNDTISIIGGVNISKPIPHTYPRILIWKASGEYFAKLPKINRDSSEAGSLLTKQLGLQIDAVKKLEIELRKMNKLSINCSQTTDYYFFTKRDTLHTVDGTCSWNGLSELYYILNGFSKN